MVSDVIVEGVVGVLVDAIVEELVVIVEGGSDVIVKGLVKS